MQEKSEGKANPAVSAFPTITEDVHSASCLSIQEVLSDQIPFCKKFVHTIRLIYALRGEKEMLPTGHVEYNGM